MKLLAVDIIGVENIGVGSFESAEVRLGAVSRSVVVVVVVGGGRVGGVGSGDGGGSGSWLQKVVAGDGLRGGGPPLGSGKALRISQGEKRRIGSLLAVLCWHDKWKTCGCRKTKAI